MANYQAPDTEFQAVANAIRTKSGTQSQLVWPNGFVSAINAIPSGGGGELPTGYTRRRGVVSNNNTAYINTGIVPNTTTWAIIECDVKTLGSTEQRSIFGSRIADKNSTFECRFNRASISDIFATINLGSNNNAFSIDTTLFSHKFEININGSRVDGNTLYNSDIQVTNQYELYLFGMNNAGVFFPISSRSLVIFSCVIGDGTGTLMNLVPCTRDSDSAVGFYDTVGNQFLTNAGSGSLIAI